MIIAIVPAAGKSQRMGRPKLLLPLGPRRVIEHVINALTRSRVDQTIVVLPPGAEDLRQAVSACPVEIAQLTEPTADMRASIVHGLDHVEKLHARDGLEAFLIALADQPTLSSSTIDHLVARYRTGSRSVLIPTYRGKRGHPAIFAWEHASRVRAIPPQYGLNHLVDELGGEVEECPMNDPSLLEDLDTPDDYQRMQGRSLHR